MNLYKYVSKLSFSLICALCGMSRFSIMFEHYLCYVCFTHDFSVTCKMYLRNKGIEYVCAVLPYFEIFEGKKYAESRPRPIYSSYAKGHQNRPSSLAAYPVGGQSGTQLASNRSRRIYSKTYASLRTI